MNIVIIHGTFGNPNENRFPWLKKQLESQWHKVWVPHFPTPENQSLSTRCNALQDKVPFVFDENTVLIWHSLWATYLLHILDRDRDITISKAIFVSGFVHELWNEKFDLLNKSFIEKDFDWDRIRKNVKEIVVLHWSNDPYVPVLEAQYLNEKLGWIMEIIDGWWHFNADAGYDKFEKLLEYI